MPELGVADGPLDHHPTLGHRAEVAAILGQVPGKPTTRANGPIGRDGHDAVDGLGHGTIEAGPRTKASGGAFAFDSQAGVSKPRPPMVITWLNSATQKHHRIIFGFLLVVVAVSFVFYTGTGQSGTLAGNPTHLGVDLYNPRATERFEDAIRLGGGAGDSRQHMMALRMGIARKHIADSLDIPTPTESEVQERVRLALASTGPSNATAPDAKTWEAYVGRVQQVLGCNRAEALVRLQTVVEDQLRWDRAAALIAGPGHVSTAAVRKFLEDQGAKWSVEVAVLDAAGFTPAITDDLAKAEAHFAANAESHRIPARLTLRAATFPSPAPNAARPVSDDEVMTHAYNFATELGIEPGKVSEAIQSRRTEIETRVRARAATEEAAAQIGDELAERFPGAKPAPAALEAWVKSKGGNFRDLPAFDAGSDVTMPGIPASALDAAATLGESGWHTDVYATANGPVLLLVQERTPSRIPAFAEVREKALAAWRASERARLLIVRANEVGKSLAAAVEQGKPFADSARTLGLTVQPSPAPFTGAEVPENLRGANLPTLGVLSETAAGKVAAPLRVAGGNFAYLRVVKRDAPQIDTSTELFRNLVARAQRENALIALYGNQGFGGLDLEGAASLGLFDELTGDPASAAQPER